MKWQKIYFLGFTVLGLAAGASIINKPRPIMTPKHYAATTVLAVINAAIIVSI